MMKWRYSKGSALIMVVLLMMVLTAYGTKFFSHSALDNETILLGYQSNRAFFAAETAIQMAYKELVDNNDNDSDGTIGTISNDGNSTNDPSIGPARYTVSSSVSGPTTTLSAAGRDSSANRTVEVDVQ